MNMQNHYVIPSLLALMPTVQTDSIISRTIHKEGGVNAVLFAFDTGQALIHKEGGVNAVLFAFDTGQALTEHRSAYTALIQILDGKATITLGEESHQLEAGAWIYMPPQLAHSIVAQSPMKMLLLMLG
jgi:quercetin dioxygenase-like cupin family protein